MTKKLYDNDSYAKEFSATIVDISGNCLILDQTLFFPEEGGQSCDVGYIEIADSNSEKKYHVTDVQIKDNIIYHTIDRDIDDFSKGMSINGRLDFEHRLSNMQQHTGEHIISGLIHSIHGYDNVGFHLSNHVVTMDYNGPLTRDEILYIQLHANKAVYENVEIRCNYFSKEELKDVDYRSKKEIDGDIRIVEIEGYDTCACCAPHLSSTGQVGLIKIIDDMPYKGGTRLFMLCGFRALKHFNEWHTIIKQSEELLNANEENIIPNLIKTISEKDDLHRQLNLARIKLMEEKLKNINTDTDFVYICAENINSKTLRETVNTLTESYPEKICACFSQNSETDCSFVLGAKNGNCNEIATTLRDKFDVKCGGNSDQISGSTKMVNIVKIAEFFK